MVDFSGLYRKMCPAQVVRNEGKEGKVMSVLASNLRVLALIVLAGNAPGAFAAPVSWTMWCMSWVDPVTHIAPVKTESLDASKHFEVNVEWDEKAPRLRVTGIPIVGMESLETSELPWTSKIEQDRAQLYDPTVRTHPPLPRLQVGGQVMDAAYLRADVTFGTSRFRNMQVSLVARDVTRNLGEELAMECRLSKWWVDLKTATAATPSVAPVPPTQVPPTAAPPTPAPSPPQPPGPPPSPSPDAWLGYQGALVGAVIGALLTALFAALIAVPSVRASKRQAKAAEDALEFSRQQAASTRTVEQMLKEGPDAMVAKLQRLTEQAMRAADRGDVEAFVANTRALASFRDSLHRMLVAAVAPLNSNLEKMSRELDKPQPDMEQVKRLLRTTHAEMPQKSTELELHLRQLLTAIASVMHSEKDDAQTRS